jgi:hypothetical protein
LSRRLLFKPAKSFFKARRTIAKSPFLEFVNHHAQGQGPGITENGEIVYSSPFSILEWAEKRRKRRKAAEDGGSVYSD